MAIRFRVEARSGVTGARVGVVETAHGSFETPAFMPVGTRATVKGLLPSQVAGTGAQVVLANTYHLMLRPGEGAVRRLGGLHAFMRWDGPILTDSGGYQVFSLADISKISEEGVAFRSVVDGSVVEMTPERAMEVQNALGADIIMALDDCPPALGVSGVVGRGVINASVMRRAGGSLKGRAAGSRPPHDAGRVREANERTVRWLERCKRAHGRASEQALFGIVQGGTDEGERRWSVERVCSVDLPGYAIGGVAVGEPSEEIASVVRMTAPLLPEGKPRYLMGVGYERDIVAACLAGVDMFDCVLPTRNGRNSWAFTTGGHLKLRNAVFASDEGVIEPGCDCPACGGCGVGVGLWVGASSGDGGEGGFSRAYIRHLFLSGEMLGPILVSLHNLRHFQRLMMDIRRTVREDDDWSGFARRWPRAAAGLPPGLAGDGVVSGGG